MVGTNIFIFGCSSSRRICSVSIFKVPQGDDEWNCIWRKGNVGENHKKNVCDCKRHYSEDY